jgi:hypothetical protein
MRIPPVALLAAASALLLGASALVLLPGHGAPAAWSPAGLDAPEPPLIEMTGLWALGALALLLSAVLALRRTSPWPAYAATRLAAAALAAAACLLFHEYTGLTAITVLILIGLNYMAWRARAWLAAAPESVRDVSRTYADAGVSILAAAATISSALLFPSLIRPLDDLGGSDAPWVFFWITAGLVILHAWLFLRRQGARHWYLLALGWGIAATFWHNWTVSGLHIIALMTLLVSALLLSRVTRRRKHPKPQA